MSLFYFVFVSVVADSRGIELGESLYHHFGVARARGFGSTVHSKLRKSYIYGRNRNERCRDRAERRAADKIRARIEALNGNARALADGSEKRVGHAVGGVALARVVLYYYSAVHYGCV